MLKILQTISFILLLNIVVAQTGNVGIGTSSPDASAKLDISATDKGLLIPRVSLSNVSTFGLSGATATAGMMVYNTNASTTGGYGVGFYYWSTAGGPWTRVANGNLPATLSNGKIWIGNASNNPIEQTMSGDATISNTGVLDLSNQAVETSEIADNAVDGTKINITSNANGDLMYYNGTDWVRLATGTTGQLLQANGAAAPTWTNRTAILNSQNGLSTVTTGGSANATTPYVELGGSLYKATTVSQAANTLAFTSTATNGFSVDGATFSVDAANDRIGIGTAAPGQKLTIASTGSVLGIDNTANFQAKNSAGTYESFFWPRWSDNVMYMNFGSGGLNIRNNGSTIAMFIDPDLSIDIKRGVLFNCDDCGSTTTIDGGSNYGDLVIQGRVLSSNSNLHLSPPNGSKVIINSQYRAAGGATGTTGLDIEDGGIRMKKSYLHYQNYKYCSCNGAGSWGPNSLGAWDFCALSQVGFKNNNSYNDEDDDVQCAVYPSNSGYGEQSVYNVSYSHAYNSRPTWYMYMEAFEDTNGVTCAANCINFE